MKILLRIILVICVLFGASAQATFAAVPTATQEMQGYILDAYKVQGDSIVATLSQNLEKMYANPADRKNALGNIQITLSLKKQVLEKDTTISEMTRSVLTQYLDYMVAKIETEKQKL